MSPAEFYYVSRAHREEQERLSRERWEIMRLEAAILIQPHVKNRITPKKLLPFPWEKSKENEVSDEGLSFAERKRRAEEALKRFG